MRADAKIEADAARAVEETVAAFGRLDIAVNNVGLLGAGDSAKTPLHELELSAWNGTLEQSLTTCMLGMKHALRVMLPARQGSIVNISSLVGMHVTPYGSYAYHAAKAGVIHLTRAAGVLYAKQGVRVNVVSPGLVLTPKTTLTLAEREQIVNDFHPSGQMVTPEEIAQAVAWLASDSSSGVTGLNLPVDGGWAAR
jgi:NAD(P)-dependent dehydrogenase (short-subunit alcohol dehydrogenase family)